jgi:hypothetical protein
LAAGVLALVSIFPSYYSGGAHLADSTPSIWYYIPRITGWSLAGLLLLVRPTRVTGAGFAFGVTALTVPIYLYTAGEIVGGTTWSTGVALDLAGLAVAVVGTSTCVIAMVRTRRLRLTTRRGAPIWAVVGGALGVAYAVSYSMSWYADHYRSTDGRVFTQTGTLNIYEQVGSLVSKHGWQLASDVVLITLAALVPLLVGFWSPAQVGAAALVGGGLALLANPLFGVASLAETIDQTKGQIFTEHGTASLWIALSAAAAMILLGFGRAIYTRASSG